MRQKNLTEMAELCREYEEKALSQLLLPSDADRSNFGGVGNRVGAVKGERKLLKEAFEIGFDQL